VARPNFQFEKRQKDLARRKKQEEKVQRRQERREAAAAGTPEPAPDALSENPENPAGDSED